MPVKLIRSMRDLAINGAPQAFAEPLHVGRPNVGDHETFLRHASEILERRWLTNNGPLVQELERKIAMLLGVKHCIAMCNGTIALEIAVRALGLGGEVIVPSWTFIATAHALHWQGITPVFADIDPATHNLDPEAVRRTITPRTTGIIGVHLWGRPAPIDELQAVADEHGLKLMFDAAHAFGCAYKGRKIGNFGACEVLSFHATKVFNTFEGGAVVTNNDELADAMRLMRNFGFAGYDNVIHPGTNGKMTEVCAAMGLTNLDSLPRFVEANKSSYLAYKRALDGVGGVKLVSYDEDTGPNYQYVVLELGPEFPVSRDDVVAALQAENVLARKYFWPGCHRMRPYEGSPRYMPLVLSNTEEIANSVIVLPTGFSVPGGAQELIADLIKAAGNSHRRTAT